MSNNARCRELESKAVKLEQRSQNASSAKESLEAAISAAELYMKALKIADKNDDKKRLDSKTKTCIKRAEALKALQNDKKINPVSRGRAEHPASTRNLTTRENIILLEGSKLNGAIFKPWQAAPSDADFETVDGETWKDNFEYSLSATQLKHFAGWKTPHDALSLIRIERDGRLLSNEVTMEKLGVWDMVQDTAPDCSVVASFCVGLSRIERGHDGVSFRSLLPISLTSIDSWNNHVSFRSS